MKNLNLTILGLLLSFGSFAQIGAISGPSTICIGSTGTETDTTSGGTWTSAAVGVATISGTGVVTGITAGVTTITYAVGVSYATYTVTVNPGFPGGITGASAFCAGTSVTETVTPTGGTWSSSSSAIATVGVGTGVVIGASAGVCVITYSLGVSCITTKPVTVNSSPVAITGSPSVCLGSTTALGDASPGGTWASSDPAIAAVGSTGGVVTGYGLGSTTISYYLGTGCTATTTVTVAAAPTTYSVTGGGSYCAGGSGVAIGLSGSALGCTYQLYIGGTAWGSPVAGTGSAISFGSTTVAGTYYISATTTGGCSAFMSGSATVAINPLPVAYTVTGGGSYCAGGAGVAVGLSNSNPGFNYQLVNGTAPMGAPIAGSGTALDFGMQTVAGTYTVIATDATTGCVGNMAGSVTVTISPLPAAYTIAGGGAYCAGGVGTAITLSGSDLGVSYQLYIGGVAVGSPVTGTGGTISFGTFTGAGTYTIVAGSISGCTSTMSGSAVITINPLPTAYTVTGGGSYCTGGAGVDIGLDGSSAGVNYQIYNGVAAVGLPMAGTGAAIDFGLQTAAGVYTVVATNTLTACTNNMTGSATVTILPTTGPPSVTITPTPGSTVCSGTSVTFTATPTGGGTSPTYSWAVDGVTVGVGSSYTYVPSGGDIVSVTMTSSSPCSVPATGTASITMTVTATLTPTIAVTTLPGTTVCTGTVTTYTTAETGGGATPTYAWTVGGTAVPGATSSTYSYTPASGDVVGVTMTSSATCVTAPTTSTSVTMAIDVPTVTATATAASCGGSVTLSASGAATYSWSPTTGLSCSTCASATVLPTATTTYTVTGTDGTGCTGTGTASADGNRISGYITYGGTPSAGDFKIWLIQFNPADSSITANDSTVNCVDGGMAYYEFMDAPAGNYLVKAKLNSSVPGTSGYIPTYSLATPQWDSAASISHTTGADSLHINMVYGTVPAGPGFIAGYVVSGAGRNTSGDIPAPGMLIYLKDAGGNTITYNYTAPDGTYSFSGLAYGTYTIYPETYKYYTTPSITITLAPGSDSATSVNFKQHTMDGTITPYDNSKVQPVYTNSNISIYPNPTTGNLNIQWGNQASGTANVVITDVVGREVYNSSVNITASGSTINMNGIKDGIYMISIKSDKIYYSGKVEKQQ